MSFTKSNKAYKPSFITNNELVLNANTKYRHNKSKSIDMNKSNNLNNDTTEQKSFLPQMSRFGSLKVDVNTETNNTTTNTNTNYFGQKNGKTQFSKPTPQSNIYSSTLYDTVNQFKKMQISQKTPSSPLSYIEDKASFPQLVSKKKETTIKKTEQFISVAKSGEKKYQQDEEKQIQEKQRQKKNKNLITLSKRDMKLNERILQEELKIFFNNKKFKSYEDVLYGYEREQDMIQEMREMMDNDEFNDWLQDYGYNKRYCSSYNNISNNNYYSESCSDDDYYTY